MQLQYEYEYSSVTTPQVTDPVACDAIHPRDPSDKKAESE